MDEKIKELAAAIAEYELRRGMERDVLIDKQRTERGTFDVETRHHLAEMKESAREAMREERKK